VIDLVQRNTEVAVPFLVSSRGYGFLWHNPAIGRVELGNTETRWVAEATAQLDYWITAGATPAEIMEHYTDATGHAPEFPEWAAGFWQCKLRYRTQDELLSVAREYKRRGLPLSMIIIDFFHWTLQGEWQFDPEAWPDPDAMVRELEEMGIRLMVSVWPTVNPLSKNFAEMQALPAPWSLQARFEQAAAIEVRKNVGFVKWPLQGGKLVLCRLFVQERVTHEILFHFCVRTSFVQEPGRVAHRAKLQICGALDLR
jgi:hypothetical protein